MKSSSRVLFTSFYFDRIKCVDRFLKIEKKDVACLMLSTYRCDHGALEGALDKMHLNYDVLVVVVAVVNADVLVLVEVVDKVADNVDTVVHIRVVVALLACQLPMTMALPFEHYVDLMTRKKS